MDILIVSDSHGRDERMKELVSRFKHLDMVIHAGDSEMYPSTLKSIFPYPLYAVRGNCDFQPEYPQSLVIPLENHKIFVTHGHRYRVNSQYNLLCEAAKENSADIAVFGHIHEPVVDDTDPDVLVLNPGSISKPRQFDFRPTYMFLYIDDKTGNVEPRICYY